VVVGLEASNEEPRMSREPLNLINATELPRGGWSL